MPVAKVRDTYLTSEDAADAASLACTWGDASNTTTGGSDTSSGDCLVLAVFWKNNVTISSISDSLSNTFTDCGTGRVERPVSGYAQILVAKNITGGTGPTTTINWSGTASEMVAYLVEFSGVDLSTPIDPGKFASATTTSANPYSTAAITPVCTDGAFVAFGVSNAIPNTAGTGFTQVSGSLVCVEAKLFTSAPGATTPSVVGGGGGGPLNRAVIIALTLQAPSSAVVSESSESRAQRHLRANANYRMSPRAERDAQQFLRQQRRAYGFAASP